MKQDIRAVTLGVADLERSREFYSKGLGWDPVMDLDQVVFYQAGFGLLLALWPLHELSQDVGKQLSHGTSFSLAHNVDSPEEVVEVINRASSAGATILKEPQAAPLFNGFQGYFADPDGYLWDVVYNPGLSILPDGTPVFASSGES